jgi:hypothetical protein
MSKSFRAQSPSKKSTVNLLKDGADDIIAVVIDANDEPLIIPSSDNKIAHIEEIITNEVGKNSTNEASVTAIQETKSNSSLVVITESDLILSPKVENKKGNDVIETKLDLSLVIETKTEKEDINDSQSSSLLIVEDKEDKENIFCLVEEQQLEEDNNEDGDFDFDSFKSINGWEECLQTTMSSAAHHAAFNGFDEVLDVLSQFFDCFVMDSKGRTPLFYAGKIFNTF